LFTCVELKTLQSLGVIDPESAWRESDCCQSAF